MITGDQEAIAKETCRQLGMGANILNTAVLNDPRIPQETLDEIIMEAHGFAEVLPEHKFLIVERIRKMGHVTGMTGDGVNDAPALKRADIGIAVHGATDAAKAAADIVLTLPGLSVIIEAIFESRKIFQRMRNYIIYRIACTFQLLLFFFLAIIAVSPDGPAMYDYKYTKIVGGATAVRGVACACVAWASARALGAFWTLLQGELAHAPNFTLPIIALVIITILNDGCMITIAYDSVVPETKPQKWDLTEVWIVSIALGLVACLSSMILLTYVMEANVLHKGGWAVLWASSGRDYMLFGELRTIM
jgi:H+-transporting ATPase